MDRQPVLEGERLLLRPLRESDFAELYAAASDPLIWEQHPIRDRWQEDVYRAHFSESLASGGTLVAVLRQDGRIVGSSQFRPTPLDPDAIEIGWTFLTREHWGTGLNHSMKRMMLDHALAAVPRVLFRIGERNTRSRMALERIGGRLTELTEDNQYQGKPIRHVVYEITRESFASGPLSLSGSASA